MIRTAVYRVQCRTFRRAIELCGIEPPEGDRGLATPGDHLLARFRVLPAYRDEHSKTLRNMVALSMRMERFCARSKS